MRIPSSPPVKFPASRDASLRYLTQAQLQFVHALGSRALTPGQRRIVNERAGYESDLKSPEVVQLTGRFAWVECSSTKEHEARAKGATTMRQVLDYAFYGEFLPADLEQQWSDAFPRP